jgi:hypothetical protein
MHSENDLDNSSTDLDFGPGSYGLITEVHFTIVRSRRSGWFITEIGPQGMPIMTHGPLDGPVNAIEAMNYLTAVRKLE